MICVPRLEIEQQVIDAALTRSPRLLAIEAPRGAGKTTLLRRTASRLALLDRRVALIDIERICTSPTDFAAYFTRAVAGAARVDGRSSMRAERILRSLEEESSRRRPDPAALLDAALAFPEAAAAGGGGPLVLLLDELGEVARLARHAGLRDALAIVARRLAPPSPIAIVAAVSPASRPAPLLELLRREAGASMSVVALPPMTAAELAGLIRARGVELPDGPGAIEPWMRATGGRPLYADILARRVAAGEPLAEALALEMTPPSGALHQECRFDYHLLVERSRGHSVVRTLLTLLSWQEGLHLSGIAQHLRIQLPTALDYLSWLLEVGLIRRDGRGYVIADPLLRLWVRLNGPEPADLMEEVAAFLTTPQAAPRPPSRPRGRRPAPRPAARPEGPDSAPAPESPHAGRDLLIEID